MDYRVFDASEIDHTQIYRLLIGSIVPRPIAWVSTVNKEGVPNLAPFSFFTAVSHAPPMVSISVGERQREMKDTTRNILETGGYVIHTVVNGSEDQMNRSSANFPPEASEFTEVGLETVPSDIVGAPRIANAPVAMECQFKSLITNGTEWKTHLVIGEILRWHVRSDLMIEDKYIDPHKLEPVGRLGGVNYCRTGDIFQMERTYPPPEKIHPNA
jgi:flavin reductase (DIM6/NTAB) family NADH-FMN oxidoreductase RutF